MLDHLAILGDCRDLQFSALVSKQIPGRVAITHSPPVHGTFPLLFASFSVVNVSETDPDNHDDQNDR